ncbi:hypothetical protein AXG93_3040s1320 [Marchantia polymorpha subsp. ruderalis]|uniref:Bifunctional inhibitor/plant lipid transfer protein/seed storage helical domain-containing protein n=1 Tax=Marchantia polymorpha subsp. ruderalis TaxID=1480154 RepID=A0A176VZS0_MARPO|nr:hypothetical protein AXG93_3040s1320 [Marchantia polymorpha subsp. ruderalis]
MMRRPHFIVVAALLLLAAFCRPSLTAEVKPDCSEQVVQLAPCLSYVSGDDPKPPEDCCDALTTVVVETPTCICEIIEGGENATASTGLLAINLTLVKQLPKECGVQEQIKIDESHCPVSCAELLTLVLSASSSSTSLLWRRAMKGMVVGKQGWELPAPVVVQDKVRMPAADCTHDDREQLTYFPLLCVGFGNQTLAPPSGPGVTSAPAQESAAVLRGQSIPSSFVWSLIISVGLWVRRP